MLNFTASASIGVLSENFHVGLELDDDGLRIGDGRRLGEAGRVRSRRAGLPQQRVVDVLLVVPESLGEATICRVEPDPAEDREIGPENLMTPALST